MATYQQNTPFNNQAEEIEVIDPTHPLFGRTFSISSVARHPKGPGNIFVHYKDRALLRIPILATTLGTLNPYQTRTKLNLSAINELLLIAMDCNSLCHNDLNTSGNECQENCSNKSCTKSHSSVRR